MNGTLNIQSIKWHSDKAAWLLEKFAEGKAVEAKLYGEVADRAVLYQIDEDTIRIELHRDDDDYVLREDIRVDQLRDWLDDPPAHYSKWYAFAMPSQGFCKVCRNPANSRIVGLCQECEADRAAHSVMVIAPDGVVAADYLCASNEEGEALAKDFIAEVSKKVPAFETATVQHEVTTTVARQETTVSGKAIGFQFNRHSMGERTITRTVRNVRVDGFGIFGEMKFLDRVLIVRKWVANMWTVVGVQYSDGQVDPIAARPHLINVDLDWHNPWASEPRNVLPFRYRKWNWL